MNPWGHNNSLPGTPKSPHANVYIGLCHVTATAPAGSFVMILLLSYFQFYFQSNSYSFYLTCLMTPGFS